MEGVFETVGGEGGCTCLAGGSSKRNFKLENFKLTVSKKGDPASSQQDLDLRDATSVTMSEKTKSITIGFKSTDLKFKISKRDEFCAWMNFLRVFDGREKQWSPIPLPPACGAAMLSCLAHVDKYGCREQGIFRVSDVNTTVNLLFFELLGGNNGGPGGKGIDGNTSPHTAAGCFKKLLHEIPETIVTNRLYEWFAEQIATPSRSEIAQQVEKMPALNREVLERLCDLMVKIVRNHSTTQMTVDNLYICLMPGFRRKDRSLIEHMKVSLHPLFAYFQSELDLQSNSVGGKFVPNSPSLDDPNLQESLSQSVRAPDFHSHLAKLEPPPMDLKLPPKRHTQKQSISVSINPKDLEGKGRMSKTQFNALQVNPPDNKDNDDVDGSPRFEEDPNLAGNNYPRGSTSVGGGPLNSSGLPRNLPAKPVRNTAPANAANTKPPISPLAPIPASPEQPLHHLLTESTHNDNFSSTSPANSSQSQEGEGRGSLVLVLPPHDQAQESKLRRSSQSCEK